MPDRDRFMEKAEEIATLTDEWLQKMGGPALDSTLKRIIATALRETHRKAREEWIRTPIRIKRSWEGVGRTGVTLGPSVRDHCGMWWTPVLWDDEEDPDFHKASGLEGQTEKEENE